MENDILLDVRDLRVVLNSDGEDVHIVNGINFNITPGKVLAMVGESGCGKSVTAQSLLCLLPHELRIASGRINFRDPDTQSTVDLASMPEEGKAIRNIRGNHIAMIFQEPMSSFSLLHTMGNQIGEVIRLHLKTSKAETCALVIELLDKVGIPDPERAIDQYPYEFSGGMRQGLGLQSLAAHCRRADDGPRRYHSGTDPRSDARSAGRIRHGDHLYNP